MKKHMLVISLLLLFLGTGLFAAAPETWANSSVIYDYPYNSSLTLTSGQTDALGYDFSWFVFPNGSDIGLETKMAISFSLDATPNFLRISLFTGPSFTTILAGGVIGFLSVGPSYTLTGTDDIANNTEQQLGLGLDLGARFRFAGNERWDCGFIVGAYSNVAFLHIVNNSRVSGLSGDVIPYVGFSFGSSFAFRHARYYPGYTVYNPVVYF
ncbi:hypothetical protein [uncultured Sphaerochaeta sp.]|uniref:hypothetical protein n=1 Tax=uncultured Sphaerochaeta sp. TaxID=886478 RepID=UPI002A0A7A90|nr:hypothetical protein [uncultured Sphaerochaeta sp.]